MIQDQSRVAQNAARRFVVLPNDRAVSLSAYCSAWRRVRLLDPSAAVSGWSYWDTTAGEVLREMQDGLTERINVRGNLSPRELSDRRLELIKAKHLKSKCRWCGKEIPYSGTQRRFCSDDCRQSFFS